MAAPMNRKNAGTTSAYQVVARELRTAILKQRYAAGARLPTEAELAVQHGVSRQTVRRAFHDLVSEGLVYRVPGRGTFPARREGQYLRQFGSIDDLMGLSIDTELELVVPLHRQVEIAAASRMRLPTDTVATTAFRRRHGDITFCYTTVYLPQRVGQLLDGVPELSQPGSRSRITVIGLLDTRLEDPIAEADQSITAVPATAEIAKQIGCLEGEPVLRVDRLYYDTEEQPVELAISYFVPEHYSYRVRLCRSVH